MENEYSLVFNTQNLMKLGVAGSLFRKEFCTASIILKSSVVS